MAHVGDGDPAQLRVGEPEDEGAVVHVVQDVLHVHLGREAHDEALGPGAAQVVGGEAHQAVEPLPEGEVPVRQRLPAELVITVSTGVQS